MGKVKTKYGKYCTFYLSTEAIAKMTKMSSGNKSAYLQALILKDYRAPETIEEFRAAEEVDLILKEGENGTI